ncbi:MAG TPA: bifunctional lysylphosphatidylglycerol flippase/synthetase MprF [Gammaproteobacteria bacterium]|nr:bifunctional lysylphosphatidylglycerol flippase/synthetase MprF [Gammaproteobacteria bacterium]
MATTTGERFRRWLKPVAALLVFGLAALVLYRGFGRIHVREVVASLRAIPGRSVGLALLLTCASYWWLGFYDVLALRYARKAIPYRRALFTAFIAYAFGHNLALAGFTGAAVRLRLYAVRGLTAIDVATVSGFCGLTAMLGLGALAGVSLLTEPNATAAALHFRHAQSLIVGAALVLVVFGYLFWASFAREPLEIRGWALRRPGPALGIAQIVLGASDFALAASVVWVLLPPSAHIGYPAFCGLYAAAVAVGLLSHVPGGLGVFEAMLLLMLPQVPTEELLGSLLAFRGIYYLGPLVAGALLFLAEELRLQSPRWARAQAVASAYLAPVLPQVAATLTFIAGTVLLLSGATPGVDARIEALQRMLPLAILEVSHLIGSLVGLGLIVLAAALHRRVSAAYHIALALIGAGIAASLLKGIDVEEAILLTIVGAVLVIGRSSFYRPASILAERYTPVWVASIVGVIAASVWVGLFAYRNVEYSGQLWWTFAFSADAPRMLRATLVVSVVGAAFLLLNLLRPARPEPVIASEEDLKKTRAAIARSEQSLANAALMGDKRLLFSDDAGAFLMYQVSGRSWIALGDPVGDDRQSDELVWRFRELSDRHAGWTVFYQATPTRLPQYIDLGLAAFKLGEEAHVPLADFSLEGGARAELRQDHRRAVRDGATFELVPAAQVPRLLPELRVISNAWLADKATAEKHFSVGAFDTSYLGHFDFALVRRMGVIVAFANLWSTQTKRELSVDLMRFGPEAPRSAMDFLFVELMLWGRAQGYERFDLGMAPLAGLEQHPLAPAWHRVGNFVFRYGEHFYNFEGLRRYKAKYRPVWEPRYLVAPGGIALPRILLDVSALISGGIKELFAK